MKPINFRQLHRKVAPIVLLPLLITALTGMSYRILKSWLGLSRDSVHFLMVIHEGEYLGNFGEPIYVFLNGLGLLFMIVTGANILLKSVKPWFIPRDKETGNREQGTENNL
ncbi:conserved hypothetical protein [Rippkaea orientalis PCC 8801]|uniref:PepSY-associated TM helix domain protein n=1 Tax=Rippkaea orientalis (strain PCC 8801 / RF-1) TaxID=41431 RepID=B7K278_RIPO1|nr:hypothetical protein [Rippkaea orientalis]ACK65214.1 conserved hypothetical protein [Rippkaea orientalis PCC 8801]